MNYYLNPLSIKRFCLLFARAHSYTSKTNHSQRRERATAQPSDAHLPASWLVYIKFPPFFPSYIIEFNALLEPASRGRHFHPLTGGFMFLNLLLKYKFAWFTYGVSLTLPFVSCSQTSTNLVRFLTDLSSTLPFVTSSHWLLGDLFWGFHVPTLVTLRRLPDRLYA